MSEPSNPVARSRTPFNPFQEWLGFPAGRIPSNYYALFGVPLFESDTQLIAQIADNMLAHLRQVRPGEHVAEWTELLDTIRTAKEWLCDPEKKKIYDEQLEAGQVRSLRFVWPATAPKGAEVDAAATQQLPPSGHIPPTAEPSLVAIGEVTPPQAGSLETAFGVLALRAWLPTVWRVAALLTLVVAIVVAYRTARPRLGWIPHLLDQFSYQLPTQPKEPEGAGRTDVSPQAAEDSSALGGSTQERSVHEETPSAAKHDNVPTAGSSETQKDGHSPEDERIEEPSGLNSLPAVPDKPDGDSRGGKTASPNQRPSPSETASGNDDTSSMQSVPQLPDGSQSSAEMVPSTPEDSPANPEGLSPEFEQIVKEIWEALGRRDLENARAVLNRLASQVQNANDRHVVEAMDQLVRDVEQFWSVMENIVASLESTEELRVGDTYVIVVEATRDYLVLRAAGQNRRYGIRQLPRVLVESLARQRLQPGPGRDVLLGVFLAVDPRGNVNEAQRLLQSAHEQGEDVSLLQEALRLRPEN